MLLILISHLSICILQIVSSNGLSAYRLTPSLIYPPITTVLPKIYIRYQWHISHYYIMHVVRTMVMGTSLLQHNHLNSHDTQGNQVTHLTACPIPTPTSTVSKNWTSVFPQFQFSSQANCRSSPLPWSYQPGSLCWTTTQMSSLKIISSAASLTDSESVSTTETRPSGQLAKIWARHTITPIKLTRTFERDFPGPHC